MSDHVRGTGGVELLEYGDFQCPYCRSAAPSLKQVVARLDGRVRLVFRHFPVDTKHPRAQEYAEAAEAVGAQGRFWDMHDVLFAHQDELEVEDLLGYAAQLGLDVERFARALDDERLAERIREDVASAEASGARGTPTFFVGDRRHVGPYDAATLARELEAMRAPAAPATTGR